MRYGNLCLFKEIRVSCEKTDKRERKRGVFVMVMGNGFRHFIGSVRRLLLTKT